MKFAVPIFVVCLFISFGHAQPRLIKTATPSAEPTPNRPVIMRAYHHAAMAPVPQITREEEKPAPKPPDPPKQKRRPAPSLLLPQATHDLYLSFWPKSDSDEFNDFKKSDLIFYDGTSTPAIYQAWDKGRNSGVRFVNGKQRTANREFPWANTAGTDENTKVIRVAQITGIRWWRDLIGNNVFNGFRWEYMPGTRFAEILLVDDPEGFNLTFEVRTRTKSPGGNWIPDVFRPFPRESDLKAALAKKGITYPDVPATPFSKVSENTRESDKRVVRGLVSLKANFVDVPEMPASMVRELLTDAVFHSAKGLKWREGAFAASSSSAFGIVPQNYEGSFFRPSTGSCMRCHQDAGKVVVEPGDERWRIRGDDAILSFHPFDPEGLRNGELNLNPRLVDRGLVVHKDGMP